jgi:hypothetical protein
MRVRDGAASEPTVEEGAAGSSGNARVFPVHRQAERRACGETNITAAATRSRGKTVFNDDFWLTDSARVASEAGHAETRHCHEDRERLG